MTTSPNQTTREEISGEVLCGFADPAVELASKIERTVKFSDTAMVAIDRGLAMRILAALQSPTDREGDRLLREVRDWCATECQWTEGTELMSWMERRDRIDAHLSRSIVGEGE
ncbi:MAG: hypothetical protein MK010_07170 [Erythrobacter sp.]|nr:hypothetical protein [Erythrobacter sp.]